MPAAIPLIIGAVATALIPAIPIFGALTLNVLIGGILSFAATTLLAKKPKVPELSSFLNDVGAGRTQQLQTPIGVHEICYGQIKKSGMVMPVTTTADDEGRTNGYFYYTHTLCATKIKAIRDIYINDGFSTDSQFTGFIRVNKHLGETDQAADADFLSEIPSVWSSNHRSRGRAYLATRLKWNATAFPFGIPNIAAIIDGVDSIYDPRTLATGFTNNAALCIADWLTKPYGQNLAWERLDEDSVIEAANICDERVLVVQYDTLFTADATSNVITLAEGARWLDWGDGVRVSSAGTLPSGLAADTTYYVIPILRNQIKLATSAANAFAGTAIDIDAGTGEHTLTYYDEARYKLNGSFTLDTEKGDVLDQLRTAMAGFVFPRGGKWFVHAGAAPTPTFDLTADDLAGDLQVAPKRSMRDRYNGIRGVYVNPDANWQPDDSPVLVPTAALLLEDDGEELYGDVRNSFVTSRRQMARLMKIELERSRRELTVQAKFNFAALKIAPIDTGTLTISRYFTEQEFQVMDWSLDQDGTSLGLLEHDPDIYDWTTADEPPETPRQGVVLPDPSGLASPENLIVDPVPETVPTNTLGIFWDAVSSIYVTGYELQQSDADAETWLLINILPGTTWFTSMMGTALDLRVRALNENNGAVSEWSYNYAPDVPGSPAYAAGDITWTSGAGAQDVQIFDSSDVLIDTVPSADETYTPGIFDTWRMRSVNSAGNISALVNVA